jgi:hypothetical protein
MSPEKVDAVFLLVFLYFAAGVVTGLCMNAGDVFGGTATPGEAFAVVLFWPLFAIKYLLIGIWIVLSSGWSLLW